ncbi:MAG: hypothetical protein NE330_00875, partial [Lentisphaeraceae bacterium]|nr:hypothetical protein [Lentisphaeraceae bacterium]
MKFFTLLTFFSVLLSTSARAPKEYSLERTAIKLNTEGITFKPFRDMESESIKPVVEHMYNFTRGTDQYKAAAYSPKELWEKDNKIATYKNRLVQVDFYKFTYSYPDNLPLLSANHVLLDEYKKRIIQIEKWDDANILKWLKYLKPGKASLELKYPKLNYLIKNQSVISNNKDKRVHNYDFVLTIADGRKYFLAITMRGGEERDAERAMKDFVKYLKIEKVKEVKASRFQSSKYKPSGKVSKEYEKTISEVKQQVLNTKGWWLAQTNNYILKSNMDSRKRTFAKKVQAHLEFIRGVYEKFIPASTEIKAVSIVTIPGTREEYLKYTGAPDWSGGVWMASRKELAVSSYTSNEDFLLQVLRHEAFHQYIYYALDENHSPAWFNEGHAELFSAVKISGSRITIIEDNRALSTLLPLFGRKAVSLSKHINLDY